MRAYSWSIAALVILLLFSSSIVAQGNTAGIDPEALIEQILTVDAHQREQVKTLVLDAEYIEGKPDDMGGVKEESRFIKKVYLKFFPDTTWYHEQFLEYYEKGKLQSPEKRDKKAAERIEKKRKRKAKTIAWPILTPFYPENRKLYEITYEGVADEKIDGFVCHHFRVQAKEKSPDLINGDYYFEAESFHLVYVEFSPAKLVKKTMFKLNQLKMSIAYSKTQEGYWFPKQFDIRGKGRAAFLFGVKFAGVEYYRNPQVNVNVPDSLFKEEQNGK